MSYKLYKISNLINNKIYIGITKLSINDRWKKHLKDSLSPLYPLHCAIQKYGKENFTIELLLESEIREEISSKEDPTIEFYKSRISQNGYNVAKGGYGGDLGPVVNKKRRDTMLNFPAEKKLEISKKLSESHLGSKRSEETKTKMSILQRERGGYGPTRHSEATRSKIKLANTGKKRSECSKRNYSNAAKLRGTGPQLQGKRVSCICCKKSWDLGNYTQHINRKNKNESK
jgi:group I intron endonuclease